MDAYRGDLIMQGVSMCYSVIKLQDEKTKSKPRTYETRGVENAQCGIS